MTPRPARYSPKREPLRQIQGLDLADSPGSESGDVTALLVVSFRSSVQIQASRFSGFDQLLLGKRNK